MCLDIEPMGGPRILNHYLYIHETYTYFVPRNGLAPMRRYEMVALVEQQSA